MNKRLNIGLIVPSADNENTAEIISGAVKSAEANNVNLFIIPVKYIRHDYRKKEDTTYHYQFTNLLEYITPKCLDGVIIESASIGTFVTAEEIKKAMRSFIDIPIVTIAQKIDDISSISFNCDGLKDAIRHLITAHRKKHIAFVSGPSSNEDSTNRYNAYREVLREFDIPFDKSLYAVGDLSEFSHNAVREIMLNNPDVDAFCFANDRMAMAGYEVIAENGRSVGKDIAVVGYDDAVSSMKIEPKLTTVHTDMSYMAYKALEQCINCIKTGTRNDTVLKSQAVFRESCGCSSLLSDFKFKFERTALVEYSWEELVNDVSVMFNCDISAAGLEPMFEYAGRLVKYAEGENEEIDVTDEVLLSLYRKIDFDMLEFDVFLYGLGVLKKKILDIAFDNGRYKAMGEMTEKITKFLICNGYEIIHKIEKRNKVRYTSTGEAVNSFISNIDKNDSFYTSICHNLNGLGVKSSHLFLNQQVVNCYVNGVWRRPEKMKYVCFSEEGIVHQNSVNTVVNTDEIFRLCSESDRQHTILISPLYFAAENYGILAAELDIRDYSYFSAVILDQVNIALKMKYLTEEQVKIHQKLRENLEQMKDNNEKLTNASIMDELTGIMNRRGFIQSASEIISMPENKGREALLVFISMNNMKKVNASFGNTEGDFALKSIANIIKRCFRGRDIVARIGGDEYAAFAFVEVPDIQEILKRRIAQYFDDLNQKSGKPYFITVSLGMYKFNCGPKVALSDVMKHTDESLRENKKNKPSGIMKPTKLSLTI